MRGDMFSFQRVKCSGTMVQVGETHIPWIDALKMAEHLIAAACEAAKLHSQMSNSLLTQIEIQRNQAVERAAKH